MADHRKACRRDTRGGFTLMEMLLVLAVMALLGTLLLPGVNSMMRSMSDEAPDRLVWDAITSARELALVTNRTVWLRVETKPGQLTWGDGSARQQRALPEGTAIQLLQPQETTRILLGGVLIDTQEVPAVRFHPDGTCDRFRVQIRQGMAAPLVVAVDPWTCAPLLAAAGR